MRIRQTAADGRLLEQVPEARFALAARFLGQLSGVRIGENRRQHR